MELLFRRPGCECKYKRMQHVIETDSVPLASKFPSNRAPVATCVFIDVPEYSQSLRNSSRGVFAVFE